MDELLAQERAAHEYVSSLQAHHEVPFKDTLAAFEQYRKSVQNVTLAQICEAERFETRLWRQHTELRKMLSRTLKDLRKQEGRSVETRIAIEMYLRFIRHSVKHYRAYIAALAATFSGIPELEAVAQQVKQVDARTKDHWTAEQGVREQVLASCHRTLIYLGDLCRYRASDELDNKPDFGPAVGYYSLACTIKPDAGWGFHQQAVVALEQKDFLKAFYHLYRSILVAEPVEMARKHLDLQYERANSAWEKGELIPKSAPGDQLASEKTLVGWFLRLHSMCVKGDVVRGYDEILREFATRLQRELRSHGLDNKLRRMAFVNIAAQHTAMDNYRDSQTPQREQAFYYSLHINLLFFLTLLDMFYTELVQVGERSEMREAELSAKLTPIMQRSLPVLRIYSNWLLLNIHLVLGLASNDFLADVISKFWQTYGQVLDAVSAVFPIFELEDSESVEYLLEEDVEALGFLPLVDTIETGPVYRSTHAGSSLKPRYTDAAIERLAGPDEMLARILGVLESGSHIAVNIEDTPIYIRGTRFSLDRNTNSFRLHRAPTPPPPEPVKPLSYAAMAAKAQAAARRLAQPQLPQPSAVLKDATNGQGSQLERMVDNLVEDDDTDHPVTPPATMFIPATVIEGTDMARLDALAPVFNPKLNLDVSLSTGSADASSSAVAKRVRRRRKEDLSDFEARPKLQRPAVSLWSPSGPVSRPESTSNSPLFTPKLHRRHNSGTSNRSMTSPRLMDSWSSIESAPRQDRTNSASLGGGIAASGVLQHSLSTGLEQVSSPKNEQAKSSLLFGGSSIWTPSKPGAQD